MRFFCVAVGFGFFFVLRGGGVEMSLICFRGDGSFLPGIPITAVEDAWRSAVAVGVACRKAFRVLDCSRGEG